MCHSFQWTWRIEHFLFFIFPTKRTARIRKKERKKPIRENSKDESRWERSKISKVESKEIHDTDLGLKVESRLLENRDWVDGIKGPERLRNLQMPGWRLRWKQKDGIIWFLLLPCNPLSTPCPAQHRTGAHHVARASHTGFWLDHQEQRCTRMRLGNCTWIES